MPSRYGRFVNRPYGVVRGEIETVGTTIGRPRANTVRPYNPAPRWDRDRRDRRPRRSAPPQAAKQVRGIYIQNSRPIA